MKRGKKLKRRYEKKIFVILLIIVLLIIGAFVIIKFKEPSTNKGSEGIQPTGNSNIQGPAQNQYEEIPLNNEQISMINETILSNEFSKDIPEDGIIALKFYDFKDGQRIWTNEVLVGKDGILPSGTPDITLMMHERYLSQLNGTNLCDVINSANNNGEMWMESSKSDVELLFKYSGLIKYRSCFGF
jgi:hypothetical protein